MFDSEENILILKAHGWELEFSKFLSIRHKETGSVATGIAAEIVLSNLKSYKVDKCFLKKVLEIAHYKAEIIHLSCENEPCLGEACLTKYLLDKTDQILEKIKELEADPKENIVISDLPVF